MRTGSEGGARPQALQTHGDCPRVERSHHHALLLHHTVALPYHPLDVRHPPAWTTFIPTFRIIDLQNLYMKLESCISTFLMSRVATKKRPDSSLCFTDEVYESIES